MVFSAKAEKTNNVCAPAEKLLAKYSGLMNGINRDLLILSKNIAFADELTMQQELAFLHKILNETESMRSFCMCTEIFDLNRCKIISNPFKIQMVVEQIKLKPFVFVVCKN